MRSFDCVFGMVLDSGLVVTVNHYTSTGAGVASVFLQGVLQKATMQFLCFQIFFQTFGCCVGSWLRVSLFQDRDGNARTWIKVFLSLQFRCTSWAYPNPPGTYYIGP